MGVPGCVVDVYWPGVGVPGCVVDVYWPGVGVPGCVVDVYWPGVGVPGCVVDVYWPGVGVRRRHSQGPLVLSASHTTWVCCRCVLAERGCTSSTQPRSAGAVGVPHHLGVL